MTLIMLAHEEIKTFSDPERDSYDRYRLRLHKRAAEMVVESADVVGFMNYVTTIRREKGGFAKETAKASSAGQRMLHLTERPAFTAKNRFDMPDSILINRGEGYAALAKYLPGHRDPRRPNRRLRGREHHGKSRRNLRRQPGRADERPLGAARRASTWRRSQRAASRTPRRATARKVELEFEVLDGAHKGRRFWMTLNLWNPNPRRWRSPCANSTPSATRSASCASPTPRSCTPSR